MACNHEYDETTGMCSLCGAQEAAPVPAPRVETIGVWRETPAARVEMPEPAPCIDHQWHVRKGGHVCKLCGAHKGDYGLVGRNDDKRMPLDPPRDAITPASAGIVALKRLAYDLLTGGHTPRDASAQLVARHGFSRTAADRYVAAVLGELTMDESAEPKETKRARLIAAQYGVLRMALSRKSRFLQNGEIVEHDAPDLRSANDALKTLMDVQGVKE